MRIFRTLRISWNRISDWLPIVFHFGTENWEEQLKKTTLYLKQPVDPVDVCQVFPSNRQKEQRGANNGPVW